MFIASFPSGPWQANCYLVAADEPSSGCLDAVVIDAGMESRALIEQICDQYQLELRAVICTHGHLDHIGDAAALANERQIPVWLHPDDYFMLTEPANGLGPGAEVLVQELLGTTTLPRPDDLRPLAEEEPLHIAGLELEVIHAPGHSPGSVILIGQHNGSQIVFSGDVIFAGSVGRVDLPGGDGEVMMATLRRLTSIIDPNAGILPGHGPTTTMGSELASNPFIKEALA